MEEVRIEERGLYIGADDDYRNALCADLHSVCRMRFRYALDADSAIRECYDYSPSLILLKLNMDYVNVLMKLTDVKIIRQSVLVLLVDKLSQSVKRLAEEARADDIVECDSNTEKDAIHILACMKKNMRYGVNIKSAAVRTPIVTELNWNDPIRDVLDYHESISAVLESLGVKKGLSGHKYLIAAIALQTASRNAPSPKRLYADVAEYYSATPLAVEKAIRYAIERAWTSGDINYQHAVFGFSVDAARGKPTNAEFIARLALEFYPPMV